MIRLFVLLCCVLFMPALSMAQPDDILRDYIPSGRIIRYDGPIKYWIGGKGRLEGQYYIDTVVAELRRILPHVSMTQTSSVGSANLRIHLTKSQEEWAEAILKNTSDQAGWQEMGHLIRGFTSLAADPGGRVKGSDVILHLDFQTSGGQRLWIVRHELMHALGVMGHPTATTDTVLNSRQPQFEKNSLFSDSDILVLQTLYRPDLPVGGSW